MKRNNPLVSIRETFALRPMKTQDEGWVWLKSVWVVTDERPVHYLGLFPEIYRYKSFDRAERHLETLSKI